MQYSEVLVCISLLRPAVAACPAANESDKDGETSGAAASVSALGSGDPAWETSVMGVLPAEPSAAVDAA